MRASVAVAVVAVRRSALAQPFPPGYVDPAPLLAAAAREIGEAELRCVTFSGTGYAGAVGQTLENAVNIDWPRIDSLRELHAHDRLGRRHEHGDVRPQARLEPGIVEVRPRLAGRHADANARRARPTSSTAATPGTSTATASRWRCRPSSPSSISSICG